MKKFLFLIAALLMGASSAVAQYLVELTTDETNPHYYKIESYNRGGVLTSNGAGQAVTHVELGEGGYWYFTAAAEEGGVIFHNYDGTQLKSNWTTDAEGDVLYVLNNGVNSYGFTICKNATIQGSDCCDAQNGGRTGVGDWSPSASDWEGTTWKFVPVRFGIDGEKDTAKETVNGYYLASASLISTAISAIDAATNTEDINTAVANALAAYQTEVAGKYWFVRSGFAGYFNTQGVYKCMTYNGTKMGWDTEDETNKNCYTKLEINEAGKLYIKAAVNGKYIQGVAGAMGDNPGGNSAITLVKYEDGTYNLNFGNGTAHTDGHGGGTGVKGGLVNWSGAGGTASSWVFIEKTEDDYEGRNNTTYTYNYVINGETYKTIEVSLKNDQEPGENIANLDFVDEIDYSIDGTTVTVYCEEALPFTVTIDETSPVVGLLRIHSNQNRYAYVDAEGKGCNTGATAGVGNKVNDFNDSYRWYITGSLIEGFKLHNLAAEGALEATATQATMTTEGSVWQLAATEGTGSKYKGFALTADGTNYLNAQGGLNYWTAADAGSAMSFDEIVEDAEVTITEAGIATYYYGYDETLALPAGVEAYALNYDGQYLQATAAPAMNGYMGYVIKGDAGTYPFVKTTGECTESELYGTVDDEAASTYAILGTVCTLDVVGGQVGFYAFEGETLAAHKAFYIYTGVEEINGLAINFGGTEGIKTIAPAQKNTLSFDLQGRRVMNAQKGLFIQNGHKYIK